MVRFEWKTSVFSFFLVPTNGVGADRSWSELLETLTVLPQVTAPWRFSIGAGAAMVDAARARTAKIEVYMLMFV